METTIFLNLLREAAIHTGNPFWLLGVYAPVGQKSFFKISKNT
jgi:hypothetical protein